jgi:penicillin-binding protein 2
VSRRTLRHPISGDRVNPRPAGPSPRAGASPRRMRGRQPRMRPRKSVTVASLVASPEDQPSRPLLRLQIVGVLVAALFAVMVLRLWSLQVIDAKTYSAAVTANQVRIASIPAPRGIITDRNGTVLVGNEVEEQILLSRGEAAQHPAVIGQVAALVGETPAQVVQAVNDPRYSPYEPVPVETDAAPATVQYLEEHLVDFPGVSVESVTQRSYPQGGTTLAQTLGYVGDITAAELAAHPNQGYDEGSQIGKTGLEAEYEQFLRGVAGTDALSVNAQGQVVGTLRKTEPTQGNTLVLNVDLGLQQTLESALAEDITTLRHTPDPKDGGQLPKAPDGAAIAIDPQNGEVLAVASYPTFDLNEFVGGISAAQLAALPVGAQNNYAIQGEYTPGSTFKLVTATTALQKGIISPNAYVDDTGTFTIPNCTGGGCTLHDDDSEALGYVNLASALAQSDDYYFYNLGAMFWEQQATYGLEPIQDVASAYGLGELTGIDLPYEATGRVDSPSVREQLHAESPDNFPNYLWYTGDNVEMAFGQGETVLTPVGLADAYATFANGGTRYQPQVAAAVVDPVTGKVVEGIAPRVTGHVSVPPDIYDPILEGLQGVISGAHGTAFSAFTGFPLDEFPLAGKTGTASNIPGEEPNSWFVAFGPATGSPTAPTALILCVIDQGGYGATAAAPVVRAGFNYLLTNPIAPLVVPTPSHPASVTPPSTVPPAGSPPTTTTTAPSNGTSAGTGPNGAATTTTAPSGG